MSLFTLDEIKEFGLPTEDQLDLLVEEYLDECHPIEAVVQTTDYIAPSQAQCLCTYCTINYNPSCGMRGNTNECLA